MTFPRTTTIVPGGDRTGAAQMVTAGWSAVLGGRTALDPAKRRVARELETRWNTAREGAR